MAENPLKYSDLIQPDNSIDELIKKLEKLDGVYDSMQQKIVDNAKQIAEALQKVNSATEQGRQATVNAAKDAENLAEENERLRMQQEQLSKSIAEAKNRLDGLRQKQAQTTEEEMRARMEKAEYNQLLKLQIKEQQALEGSYDKLSAQYSLMKKKLNAMSAAERENTKEGKALEEQARATYEQMKKLQEATGKHQLNVGNYPEAIKMFNGYADSIAESVAGNNSFASSLLKLSNSGAGASGFLGSLKAGISAFGSSLTALLANPVFLAVAGIAGAAMTFKWWYDYNKGLVQATRLTKQFTGKEGEDLKQYRNEVQAIADTFDKDFNEVLQSANALSKQFGITADEALKTVKNGFMVGADVNGEYLDTLKEYPAYFKEAGLSAEQFVAITAKGAKDGVFSDKAVDTIKEANLRLREMPTATAAAIDGIGLSSKTMMEELRKGEKTTFQLMQEISKRMSELPESASEVGTAIADIFGGPGEDAGLKFLTSLKDINGNLQEMVDNTDEVTKAQNRVLESNIELENALSEVFDATDGFFESLSADLQVMWNDVLIWLITGIKDLYNWFVDLYNGSEEFRVSWAATWEPTKALFKQIWALIKQLGRSLMDLGDIVTGVITLDPKKMKAGYTNLVITQAKFANETEEIWGNTYLNIEKARHNQLKRLGEEEKRKNDEAVSVLAFLLASTAASKVGKTDDPEKTYKDRLAKLRAYEDSEVALIEDAEYRKAKAEELGYRRRIEDLRHYLLTQKNLTDEEVLTAENGIKLAQRNLDKMQGGMERNLQTSLETQQGIVNTNLQGIQQNIEGISKKREINDIYGIFGLTLDDKQKEAISVSMQYATQALSDYINKRVEVANRAVELANSEVDANQALLEREMEARENGLANSVEFAEQALSQSKRTQREALKQQQRAQRQQAALQAVEQCNNLITATSQIWAGLGSFPPAAIAAIGVMWASFAASKITAAKATRQEQYGDGTVELLKGGSHASGNDISLGFKEDGTERRAEGGEFFAVINKRNSRKYRSIIPALINSLNNGTYQAKFGDSFNTERNSLSLSYSADMDRTNKILSEIEDNTSRRTYTENGKTVTEYKNVKTISR